MKPMPIPGTIWWREDTPTIMDGCVVRYVPGDPQRVHNCEISASRNGVAVYYNDMVSNLTEFKTVLEWARAQAQQLRAHGHEPLPLETNESAREKGE